uniref:alpha/beta fold hydrolase n=1 Tax=Catenulispora rubra TaxID=280293 RepID=UPI0018921E5F
ALEHLETVAALYRAPRRASLLINGRATIAWPRWNHFPAIAPHPLEVLYLYSDPPLVRTPGMSRTSFFGWRRFRFDAAMWGAKDAAVSDEIENFVDVPGGFLCPGSEPYSEIEDIAAVMDAAGVRSAVLVGVSDGARRVLAFAHRYPERTSRGVVVGGTFGDFPDPSPQEATARQEMKQHFARREETLTALPARGARIAPRAPAPTSRVRLGYSSGGRRRGRS